MALKNDLLALEVHLRRHIGSSQARLAAKLDGSKAELILWMIGVGMLQVSLIAALLLRLLPS